MKIMSWIWASEQVGAVWGHVNRIEMAGRLPAFHGVTSEEIGEPTHLFVCRDPDKDGQGDADEAWRECKALDDGARAITIEVV